MALGLHGQLGAVVARPVVEEQQPDGVPVWGIRAWEKAKTIKIVKQGNAQCATKSVRESFCLSAALMESPITANVCSKMPPVSLVEQSLLPARESATTVPLRGSVSQQDAICRFSTDASYFTFFLHIFHISSNFTI